MILSSSKKSRRPRRREDLTGGSEAHVDADTGAWSHKAGYVSRPGEDRSIAGAVRGSAMAFSCSILGRTG
jgi:hypothetical protein